LEQKVKWIEKVTEELKLSTERRFVSAF